MKISQATCSYEILRLESQLWNSPNQFNYLKIYLNWPRFELKIFWKTKPLTCLNQLSYWNRQDWWQFFKALCMRKRGERRRTSLGWRTSLATQPPPPAAPLTSLLSRPAPLSVGARAMHFANSYELQSNLQAVMMVKRDCLNTLFKHLISSRDLKIRSELLYLAQGPR